MSDRVTADGVQPTGPGKTRGLKRLLTWCVSTAGPESEGQGDFSCHSDCDTKPSAADPTLGGPLDHPDRLVVRPDHRAGPHCCGHGFQVHGVHAPWAAFSPGPGRGHRLRCGGGKVLALLLNASPEQPHARRPPRRQRNLARTLRGGGLGRRQVVQCDLKGRPGHRCYLSDLPEVFTGQVPVALRRVERPGGSQRGQRYRVLEGDRFFE